MSHAEQYFAIAWRQLMARKAKEIDCSSWEWLRLACEPQFKFHPKRKFLFDFAWPHAKLALEIDGLGRKRRGPLVGIRDLAKFKEAELGGHRTIKGMMRDHEKQNEAAIMGWRVMRVLAKDKARAHEWAAMVLRALEAK